MRFLIITLGLMAGGIIPAMAQTFGLAYTTEGQYGVKSKQANWVNLLRLDMEYPLYKNGGISLATVHIYKLKDNCVADDKLTFSNIEEDMAIAGFTFRPVSEETNEVTIVIPADGPSLGTAPAGTCTWIFF